MKTIYQHVTDRGLELTGGQVLENVHVIRGGALYGRVLFTTVDPCVRITGHGNVVSGCILEDRTGAGVGISVEGVNA